jgi:hypothetical protein
MQNTPPLTRYLLLQTCSAALLPWAGAWAANCSSSDSSVCVVRSGRAVGSTIQNEPSKEQKYYKFSICSKRPMTSKLSSWVLDQKPFFMTCSAELPDNWKHWDSVSTFNFDRSNTVFKTILSVWATSRIHQSLRLVSTKVCGYKMKKYNPCKNKQPLSTVLDNFESSWVPKIFRKKLIKSSERGKKLQSSIGSHQAFRFQHRQSWLLWHMQQYLSIY